MPNKRRFKPERWQWLFALSLSVMLFVVARPLWAVASTAQQDLQCLDALIAQAVTKADAKDWQGAATAYKQFDNEWFDVEDGVKQTSRQAYRDIESAMGEVKFGFSTKPPKQSQVVDALLKLHAINQKFISGGFNQSQSVTAPTNTGKITIATLISRLNQAEAALNSNNVATAATEMRGFQTDWLEVEGVVATKSKQAYVDIENNMAKAYGLLKSNPPNVAEARAVIVSLKLDLQPFAGKSLQYNLFDAAAILLREGLEALLVLVALLAFLKKSGNADQGRWLWVGAAPTIVLA